MKSNFFSAECANPFFAARQSRPRDFQFAKLPQAPKNASPVPWLTSLYHHEAGDYGDRAYPGNCGGNLIADVLKFFKPHSVFDPMSGSGTCKGVCEDLGIECVSGDIHDDFDLCDSNQFYGPQRLFEPQSFGMVWLHPPYWRQKLYALDSRDLSRAPTLEAFLNRYAKAIANCTTVLELGGKLAILMGDYHDREKGFIPLTYHTKRLAFEAGLQQTTTDIIRFSHGASSSKKVYSKAIIPGLHDVLMIFEKVRP